MFVGFTRRIKNASGFRLGLGMRVNKKNAIWLSFILLFVLMFQLMWKLMILTFWGMLWMFYGIFLMFKYMYLGMAWCIKKLYHLISNKIKASREAQ